MTSAARAKLERLAQWRFILAARLVGLKHMDHHPQRIAIDDIFERLLVLRAEVNALVTALTGAAVIGMERYSQALTEEAERLFDEFEQRFPGMRAHEIGIEIIDAERAAETMKAWPQ